MARAYVPELHVAGLIFAGVVGTASGQDLPVRAERHRATAGLAADGRPHRLSGGRRPEAGHTVGARRGQRAAIRAVRQRVDQAASVAVEDAAGSVGYVPEPYRAVVASGGQGTAVRGEGERLDGTYVEVCQRPPDLFARRHIP